MEKFARTDRFQKDELLVDETIFSVANGYIGIRGSFTEGYGTDYEYNQTYINGLYDFYDYHYEENLSGFPQRGQRFVNVIDGQKITIAYEDGQINLTNCNIVSLERYYHMENGFTKRFTHYQTKDKLYDFYIEDVKFVSRYIPEVIGIELKMYSPNYHGDIQIKSFLQKSNKGESENKDPRIQATINNMEINSINLEKQSILSSTKQSDFFVESKMIHNVDLHLSKKHDSVEASGYFKINTPFVIQKYVIHTSNLYSKDIQYRTKEITNQLLQMSWKELLEKQTDYYNEFCKNSFINSSNKTISNLLNYNIYQLNNSGGENDIHNISAKGLSGEGYEGHYFWDTEIYMIPFFVLTNPLKAKNLLMYRYRTIEQAKQEARKLGYTKGAKIPWRTINGEETSPYYPAGSAQFHINSDIAYAIIKYFEATNDVDFLINYGFELLIETARFLDEAVNLHNGQYHLNSVTGPDEYTTVVDDNFYTNILLQYHFTETVHLYTKYKNKLKTVIKNINITTSEIEHLKDVANGIFLPFDKSLNIFAQDKNFLSKAIIDLSTIPEKKFPLLLHYHPLYLYKHQVLKQADTMLALLLLDYDKLDILEDTYNYYEPITTHDSSLSKCIYSIIAFKLKKFDVAIKYFNEVLKTDFNNTHSNTENGLHVANLGGSYLGFIYGLLGLRIHRDYLKLEPHRIKEIPTFTVQISYQGEVLKITLNEKLIVESTGKVKLMIYNNIVEVIDHYETVLPK